MQETIDTGYRPREPFIPFHRRPQRFCTIVAHRRAGKTVACIADLVDAAIRCEKPDGRFAYVAPYYNQAKDTAWTYLKKYSAGVLATPPNESELRVDLFNGSRIRLYGADNPDRLRGIYLDGVILDEYADMQHSVWGEVIRPLLSDRQGWATFIGTPKGKNSFYDIYRRGIETPDEWLSLMLRASETGLIGEDELAAARRDMTPEQYEQEFECSFDVAITGAYYAAALAEARAQGRIGRVARDPLMVLKAFWDIGVRDATAIWVAQFVGREIRVLDYYEAVGQPLAAHLEWLRSHGYSAAECVLPHDGAHQNEVTAIRFEDHIRSAGFQVRTIANQGKGAALKRIEAARRLFPALWFNDETCRGGLDALGWYHERRDENRDIGLGPEHDWSSHAADAFGLMCIAYEEPRGAPLPKFTPRKVV